MFRFIDNFHAKNSHMEFDKNYKDNYPLKLKKEGISTFDASF